LSGGSQSRAETLVFGLIFIFFVVFVSLTVVLWVVALVIQNLLYSEPIGQLYWRAPAASAALMALVGLWCLLDFLAVDPAKPDIPYDTLRCFSPVDTKEVDQFWAVQNGKETLFKKRTLSDGKKNIIEYRDDGNNPFRRSDTEGVVDTIVIQEGGQKIEFKAKLD
jgi:hypothetical protein